MPRLFRLFAPLVFVTALPVAAASPDAWEEFRANVDKACRALVQEQGTVTVEVDPFGSQSFGAAIVTVDNPAGWQSRAICIFDKETGAAEMTAGF